MREKRFTLRRSQRAELWRRFTQTDDLALILSSTNATFAEEPLSAQRIGRLRRLVDADDRGLDTRSGASNGRPCHWRLPGSRCGGWLER